MLVSACAFSLMFFLTPLLDPLDPVLLAALRMVLGSLSLLCFFAVTKSLPLVRETWQHLRAKPWRLLVTILLGLQLASQLWLFAYGPLHGRALHVSLGYFLMPLVLVLIGKFFYKDKLSWWHWLAVALASAGVAYETVRVGGIAWEALWVSLMYPLYFVVRRAIGISHLGGMFWEMLLLTPAALVFFVAVAPGSHAFNARPELWLYAPLFGLLGSAALVVWILAAKYLSMSLFGLLSYLEPALLMLVALLLGEQLHPGEIPLYAAVLAAVAVVMIGGTVTVVQQRRKVFAAQDTDTVAQTEPDPITAPLLIVQQHKDSDDSEQMLLVAATGSIPIIDVTTFADEDRKEQN